MVLVPLQEVVGLAPLAEVLEAVDSALDLAAEVIAEVGTYKDIKVLITSILKANIIIPIVFMFCDSFFLWSSKSEEHLDSISLGLGPYSCFYQLCFCNDVALFSRSRPKHVML